MEEWQVNLFIFAWSSIFANSQYQKTAYTVHFVHMFFFLKYYTS